MLAAARLGSGGWTARFRAPRVTYRCPHVISSSSVLLAARLYSTEKAQHELVTDESAALPTLEAIDAIVAGDQESARMAHASQNKRWSTTFRRVNSSFTRPQLFELAQEAQLMGIKRTLSKAEIVRAFLEQRFDMRDPGVENSPSEQHPTTRRLRVADYEAFFLMQSEQLLERASSANVQLKLGKLDRITPVVLAGPRAGVSRIYEQLQGVRQNVKQHMVALAPSATGGSKKTQPETLPDALMRHISLISRCYVGATKGHLCIWYSDPARLQIACSLVYQALDLVHPRFRPLFAHGGNPDAVLVLMPHSAASSALNVLSRGALRHTHARWTRGPNEDAPAFHGYRQSLETALQAAQKQLATDEATLPESLRAGPYVQLQHATFGHLLWPTESLCTAQLQREVLQQCAPKKRNSQSHALFLPSLPPSCIASEVDLGHDWDYVSDESTDSIRLTYRVGAAADSLLEVWLRPTARPKGAAFQGLLPDTNSPEAPSDMDQGRFFLHSARWIHRQEVDILHPDRYALTLLLHRTDRQCNGRALCASERGTCFARAAPGDRARQLHRYAS